MSENFGQTLRPKSEGATSALVEMRLIEKVVCVVVNERVVCLLRLFLRRKFHNADDTKRNFQLKTQERYNFRSNDVNLT